MLPDPDLSTHFTDRFMERPSSVDLLLAVNAWYKPYPFALAPFWRRAAAEALK